MPVIVITGPESTGKSTLTNELAGIYQGIAIPEYARQYIVTLQRPYNYSDVELIARKQVEEFNNISTIPGQFFFLDTYLIITKVWFEVVFGHFPTWMEKEIRKSKIDLFLLCEPDIPWEPDSVRENGGEMRNWLYDSYKQNLNKYMFNYEIVNGLGPERIQCARRHMDRIFFK